MLFLFNDVVFDLGDPLEHLEQADFPLPRPQLDALSAGALCQLVREAVFAAPDLPHSRPTQASHLCALIAIKAPSANALLAVPQADAKGPEHVGLRFASAPIFTLTGLLALQNKGRLGPSEANFEVWTKAG